MSHRNPNGGEEKKEKAKLANEIEKRLKEVGPINY